MDDSDFLPSACSTVGRKKVNKNVEECSISEENSLLLINNSHQRNKKATDLNYELDKLQYSRANKVASIPSKYLRANYTKSESTVNIPNESTISESDLLQTPRNASTPRCSIGHSSLLKESLTRLSHKVIDSKFSIANVLDDIKQAVKSSEEERSSMMFKPGEEADSMLLADELSWRKKNYVPFQEEPFSNVNMESIGEFFQERCDRVSEFFTSESPNTTKDPMALIEQSLTTSTNIEVSPVNKEQSLSISMIQKFITDSDYTPKRAFDNILKLSDKVQATENKQELPLPSSKNSSYTSNFSENNAIKDICNKENIDSVNAKTASTQFISSSRSSSRASSTLSSLENGKLPIETTKCDLIWGCVKVGKSSTQEFIIRNKSAKRLLLQLSLSSQEFKIRKDNRSDSEQLSHYKVMLHPYESKAIIVSFMPTKKGTAVDEMHFKPLEQNLSQRKKQCVLLFGYGGSIKVDFSNLTRDTTGKFWLSLGKLDNRTVFNSSFKVKNKGDIPVFIHISIQSYNAYKLEVSPNFFVLMPQVQKEILISYRPSNDDYNFAFRPFHNVLVVELGNLNISFGSEVDRGRIRNICDKCVDTGLKIDPLADVLQQKIDGEVMPLDLMKFKESSTSLRDLMKLINHHQVVLTVERDPEQTILQQYSDDSFLYQSLYQDTTQALNKTSILNSCRIAPNTIILTIPYKCKDTVFLKSESDMRLNFKINCPSELEAKPKEGILEVCSTAIVTIKCNLSCEQNEKKCMKVLVIIENEIFEIDVKIEFLGQLKNKKKSIINCL